MLQAVFHALARVILQRHGLAAVLLIGRAVAITSVLVALALGVNALSSFPAMRVVGYLGAFMMFAALVVDVMVLPAILAAFKGRSTADAAARGSQ